MGFALGGRIKLCGHIGLAHERFASHGLNFPIHPTSTKTPTLGGTQTASHSQSPGDTLSRPVIKQTAPSNACLSLSFRRAGCVPPVARPALVASRPAGRDKRHSLRPHLTSHYIHTSPHAVDLPTRPVSHFIHRPLQNPPTPQLPQDTMALLVSSAQLDAGSL